MPKSSYQYLQEFCKIKSQNFYTKLQDNWNTPRTDYIIQELKNIGVDYETDVFSFQGVSMGNIYVFFNSKNQDNSETALFLAHHDINNSLSENCQDNSASVCHLLNFCSLLKDLELDKNIIVAFTDGEELVNMFNSGAGVIGKKFKDGIKPFCDITYAINLELTGKGKNIWYEKNRGINFFSSKIVDIFKEKIPNTLEFYTPYNDSYALRNYGINSLCIGCLDDDNIIQLQQGLYPKTWKLCHSIDDTIEKVSEEDMDYFVSDVLMKLI